MATYKPSRLYFLFVPPFIVVKTMVNVRSFNTATWLMILYILIRWVIKKTGIFNLILTLIDCSYQTARMAHFVVGDVCQVGFSLGDVAVPAPADGVRVIVRESLALLARVEAEDASRVLLQGFLTSGTCFFRIGGRVL